MQQQLPPQNLKKTLSEEAIIFFISTNLLWASVGKPNVLIKLDLPWGYAILLGLNTTTFETFAIPIRAKVRQEGPQIQWHHVTSKRSNLRQPTHRVHLFLFFWVWTVLSLCLHTLSMLRMVGFGGAVRSTWTCTLLMLLYVTDGLALRLIHLPYCGQCTKSDVSEKPSSVNKKSEQGLAWSS